ncbi:transposase [Nitrospira sp. BLG_1]|uniref:IS701 family transposase n=1 Tax=Nitrospira sp. BLG_1 TaxID=3395883 RepID=UPI0039BC90E5
MNPPKVDEYDYIQFLLAAQRVFSTVEASKVISGEEGAPAHDAYTRLLQRIPPDSQALWREVEQLTLKTQGVLVIDDTTLDKPYAEKMALVSSHWSGKHHAVVMGINLISLLWTDGKAHVPCDFRLYNHSQDGLTKNDHFQNMLHSAQERGFTPELVVFDSWYSSLENLKTIRGFGWHWLTQVKKNRLVSLDRSGNRQVSDWLIPSQGQKMHLKGYGWIKVFKTVAKNGSFEYWATSQLNMTLEACAFYALDAWQIEVYHRGLKQNTGIERGQFRLENAQKNHIALAIRAFVRLEVYRLKTDRSWFEAKQIIIRQAIRAYLKNPSYILSPTA